MNKERVKRIELAFQEMYLNANGTCALSASSPSCTNICPLFNNVNSDCKKFLKENAREILIIGSKYPEYLI